MTATVRHLPTTNPTLDEQVKALQPGQWVRVTWRDNLRGTNGTVEGTLRRPSNLTNTLFVDTYCVRLRGFANTTLVKVETTPPDDLDMDVLTSLVEEWTHAMAAVDDAPLGKARTGDNTAEQNAAYDAETAVRAYLRGVRV